MMRFAPYDCPVFSVGDTSFGHVAKLLLRHQCRIESPDNKKNPPKFRKPVRGSTRRGECRWIPPAPIAVEKLRYDVGTTLHRRITHLRRISSKYLPVTPSGAE